MVYQFIGEDDSQSRMKEVTNPYQGIPAAEPPPDLRSHPPLAATAREQPRPDPALRAAAFPKPDLAKVKLAKAASPKALHLTRPLIPKSPPRRPQRKVRQDTRIERRTDVPAGFVRTRTRHFEVYAEDYAASEKFLALLENLHGNLMLDLAAFSPWTEDYRVMVFLFKNQDTYREVTGRPAWSGGASSVRKRKIYLYMSEELPGIMAHELCHIYFDSFFLSGKPNPLWLSEGMATLVQIERGLAPPSWLHDNLVLLKNQGGYTMEDLMRVTSTTGAEDANVRLWYAQAYTTVRFLIRTQYKSSFYNFSRYLREGKTGAEALYRAYGMPFTSLKALEYAWRYDLTTHALPQLQAPPR